MRRSTPALHTCEGLTNIQSMSIVGFSSNLAEPECAAPLQRRAGPAPRAERALHLRMQYHQWREWSTRKAGSWDARNTGVPSLALIISVNAISPKIPYLTKTQCGRVCLFRQTPESCFNNTSPHDHILTTLYFHEPHQGFHNDNKQVEKRKSFINLIVFKEITHNEY